MPNYLEIARGAAKLILGEVRGAGGAEAAAAARGASEAFSAEAQALQRGARTGGASSAGERAGASGAAERPINGSTTPRMEWNDPRTDFLFGGARRDPRYRPPMPNRIDKLSAAEEAEWEALKRSRAGDAAPAAPSPATALDEALRGASKPASDAAGAKPIQAAAGTEAAATKAAQPSAAADATAAKPAQPAAPDASTAKPPQQLSDAAAPKPATSGDGAQPAAKQSTPDAAPATTTREEAIAARKAAIAEEKPTPVVDQVRAMVQDADRIIQNGGRAGDAVIKRDGKGFEIKFDKGPFAGDTVLVEGNKGLASNSAANSVHEIDLTPPPQVRAVPRFAGGY